MLLPSLVATVAWGASAGHRGPSVSQHDGMAHRWIDASGVARQGASSPKSMAHASEVRMLQLSTRRARAGRSAPITTHTLGGSPLPARTGRCRARAGGRGRSRARGAHPRAHQKSSKITNFFQTNPTHTHQHHPTPPKNHHHPPKSQKNHPKFSIFFNPTTAAYVHMRVHDAQTGGHGWAGLTELQGVTIDFWGGPQLHLWPQAARPL